MRSLIVGLVFAFTDRVVRPNTAGPCSLLWNLVSYHGGEIVPQMDAPLMGSVPNPKLGG